MTSVSDAEQLAYATRREAVIVTYNVRHFRSLSNRMRPHGGVVTLPDSPLDWQEVRAAMLIDWAASFPDYRSHLFRWHDLQQRLIGGMRLADYSEDEVRMALGQMP
jgi:hypothetical protein